MSRYQVTFVVDVKVNRKKFNKTFMREFRQSYYKFDTIAQHKEHLAQLFARGLANDYSFIEGYGHAERMGITFKHVCQYTEKA